MATKPPAKNTAPTGHDVYCAYRDYIKQEDNLINNRVGWFIQLHSFLIATYGIVFASFVSTFATDATSRAAFPAVRSVATMLLGAISVAGIVSSVSAALSIWAAHQAITTLNARWKELKPIWDPDNLFPGMVGGGREEINRRGSIFHMGLPTVLLILWLASFFLLCRISALGAA